MTTDATELDAIERAIVRVKSGSTDDYRMVVAAFHHRLRAALVGMCPPGIDHEEVAQLAFIEAYRKLNQYTPNTNFFAWLCAIARYRLLAESKRLLRQGKNQENYLNHAITQQLLSVAEQREEITDLRSRFLGECLSVLKPHARALVGLRYDRRQSIANIAEALGKSVSAVSVQLFAIRSKLRDCVEAKLRSLNVAS